MPTMDTTNTIESAEAAIAAETVSQETPAENQYTISDDLGDDIPQVVDDGVPAFGGKKPVEGEVATPKPAPKPVEKPAQQAAAKPLSRSDWGDYGLTEDQARRLDEKGELGTVLDLYDRQILQAGKAATAQPAQTPTVPAANAAAQVSPELAAARQQIEQLTQQVQTLTGKSPAGSTGAGEVPDGLRFNLDPEVYGEEILTNFRNIEQFAGKHATRVQQLEQIVSNLVQYVQDQQQMGFVSEMDSFFNSLGDDYADLVGKGTVNDLAPDSPQFKTRVEVTEAMAALREGYKARGLKVPPKEILRERAKRLILGDRTQEVARRQVAEQARNAQGQFVARATHREGQELSAIERADKRLDDFYRSKGLM